MNLLECLTVPMVVTTVACVVLPLLMLRFRSKIKRIPLRKIQGSAAETIDSVNRRFGLRLVCISDTHGQHHQLVLPAGDVLIHAGDFTQFGSEEQLKDFDTWLAAQPHKTKLVVLGNHENKAPWSKNLESALPHATAVLHQSNFRIPISDGTASGLCVFGTDFFWPMAKGKRNPYFDQIPDDADLIIAHGPAAGCADGGKGCTALLNCVKRIRPALVISGHIHFARGAAVIKHFHWKWWKSAPSTVLINAANCGSGAEERELKHQAIVVDI